MDEQAVRERAQQMCESLIAGDVDRAFGDASDELRRHLGEVVGLLPLPVTEATIQSIDRGGSGYSVILRLTGEYDEDEIQVRWKDRDGQPRIVEASHLSRTARAQPAETDEETATEGTPQT